jgi:hypothetical protein
MTLLKINGEFYFAVTWGAEYEDDKLPPSRNPRMPSTPAEFDQALFELCWALQSCAEAIEVFADFEECPVCLARKGDSGKIMHKAPYFMIN